jgi:(S)-3,5-dihydroxyphenylglycine transaminase
MDVNTLQHGPIHSLSDRAVPAPGASSRMDVMNFLNEIASDYPSAISFASGRPAETLFEVEQFITRLPDFVRHVAQRDGTSAAEVYNMLAQYGRTNGIINDLIAAQVAADEGIQCSAHRVLVTTGCQEAMELCVMTLCREDHDVILARSPTYIGITGVADLHRKEIVPFSCQQHDMVPELRRAVDAAERAGKRPRALYLVPDFDNPTGEVLTHATREEIIAFCASKNIVILEDNPYGLFRYEGADIPRMSSLDKHGCVAYLGTYAKSVCPGLRVGFVILPERLFGEAQAADALLNALSQAKSFVTCNTSQISQAVVGGVLLSEQCKLSRRIAPAIEFYRKNRDTMLQSLERSFQRVRDVVSWNRPEGGFFLTVTLPFSFTKPEAQICAQRYGVLVMPLSFFALIDDQDNRVRLAFSNTTPARIQDGIERFSRFVHDRLGR